MFPGTKFLALLNLISITFLVTTCPNNILKYPNNILKQERRSPTPSPSDQDQQFQEEGRLVAPTITTNGQFMITSSSANDQPAIVNYSENGQNYPWFSLPSTGAKWPANKRAIIVQQRLEYYRKQQMQYFVWGTSKTERVICTYTRDKPNICQLVLIVPKELNVTEILLLVK